MIETSNPNAWKFGPAFRFLSGGMGTIDYMHKSGKRYRHPMGEPETLSMYGEPAPADVAADWVEFRAAEQVRFVGWCAARGFDPAEFKTSA